MNPYLNSLESIKDIIREIKNTPGVYNVRHDDFLVIERREQCWKNIAEAVNISEEELRNKWRVLRDRYVRYQRKLTLGRITRNNIRFPFYDQMRFLDPFIKRRTPRRLFNLPINKNTNINISNDLSGKTEKDDFMESHDENGTTTNDYSNNEEDCTLLSLDNVNYSPEDGEIIIEQLHDVKHEDENTTNEQYINEETVYVDPSITDDTAYYDTSNCESNEIEIVNPSKSHQKNSQQKITESGIGDEDDLFGKSLGLSLKKLSRLNNVRAKAEIYRVLQKYIEQEEMIK